MKFNRTYRGIEYRLTFNGFWRVYSEIGNFYGHNLIQLMNEFRNTVNAGPDA